jgi:hypothetical protein
MRRRVRWLVIVAVVAVLAVIAAGALISPKIGDARDQVDARWTPLRSSLKPRYEALRALASVMHDAGAGERAVTQDLDTVLGRWFNLSLKGPTHSDAGREAETANELEALARRLEANIDGSDRLSLNETVKAAVLAFHEAFPEDLIADEKSYNRAVRAYERERSGAIKRLVAAVLGYDSRPLLVIGGEL